MFRQGCLSEQKQGDCSSTDQDGGKRRSNAAEEIHKAIEKLPPEITIKFFR